MGDGIKDQVIKINGQEIKLGQNQGADKTSFGEEYASIFDAIDEDGNGILDQGEIQKFENEVNQATGHNARVGKNEFEKFKNSFGKLKNVKDLTYEKLQGFMTFLSKNKDIIKVATKDQKNQNVVDITYEDGIEEVIDYSTQTGKQTQKDGNVTTVISFKLNEKGERQQTGKVVTKPGLRETYNGANKLTKTEKLDDKGNVIERTEYGKPDPNNVGTTHDYTYKVARNQSNDEIVTKAKEVEHNQDGSNITTEYDDIEQPRIKTIVDKDGNTTTIEYSNGIITKETLVKKDGEQIITNYVNGKPVSTKKIPAGKTEADAIDCEIKDDGSVVVKREECSRTLPSNSSRVPKNCIRNGVGNLSGDNAIKLEDSHKNIDDLMPQVLKALGLKEDEVDMAKLKEYIITRNPSILNKNGTIHNKANMAVFDIPNSTYAKANFSASAGGAVAADSVPEGGGNDKGGAQVRGGNNKEYQLNTDGSYTETATLENGNKINVLYTPYKDKYGKVVDGYFTNSNGLNVCYNRATGKMELLPSGAKINSGGTYNAYDYNSKKTRNYLRNGQPNLDDPSNVDLYAQQNGMKSLGNGYYSKDGQIYVYTGGKPSSMKALPQGAKVNNNGTYEVVENDKKRVYTKDGKLANVSENLDAILANLSKKSVKTEKYSSGGYPFWKGSINIANEQISTKGKHSEQDVITDITNQIRTKFNKPDFNFKA